MLTRKLEMVHFFFVFGLPYLIIIKKPWGEIESGKYK